MSEPRTVTVPANAGQKLTVTERKVKDEKGEMVDYLSFSNGMEVCGVYMTAKTREELAKFFSTKPKRGKTND